MPIQPIPPNSRFQDLTGQRFRKLIVLGYSHAVKYATYYARLWVCQCDCGKQTTTHANSLKSGKTTSCGCASIAAGKRTRTHGHARTPIYQIWNTMQHRCLNPKAHAYERYGGRGITVCDRWRGKPQGLLNFIADMGPRPSPDHTIDRFPDKNGNYEPGNCRWATWTEQNQNKDNNRMLTFRGETKTATEWTRILGMKTSTLWNRLKNGMTDEEALTTPVAPHVLRR